MPALGLTPILSFTHLRPLSPFIDLLACAYPFHNPNVYAPTSALTIQPSLCSRLPFHKYELLRNSVHHCSHLFALSSPVLAIFPSLSSVHRYPPPLLLNLCFKTLPHPFLFFFTTFPWPRWVCPFSVTDFLRFCPLFSFVLESILFILNHCHLFGPLIAPRGPSSRFYKGEIRQFGQVARIFFFLLF